MHIVDMNLSALLAGRQQICLDQLMFANNIYLVKPVLCGLWRYLPSEILNVLL